MAKSKDLPPIEDILVEMPDDLCDLQEVSLIVFNSAFGDHASPFERMRAKQMLPHIRYKLNIFQGFTDDEVEMYNRQYEMKYPAYAQMFRYRYEICKAYYANLRNKKDRRHRRAVKRSQDTAPQVGTTSQELPIVCPLSDRSFFTDNSEMCFLSEDEPLSPPLIVYRPEVPLEAEAAACIAGQYGEGYPSNAGEAQKLLISRVSDLSEQEAKTPEMEREVSVSVTSTHVVVKTSTHKVKITVPKNSNHSAREHSKVLKRFSDKLSNSVKSVRVGREPQTFDISGISTKVYVRRGPRCNAARLFLNRRPERLVPFVDKYKDTPDHWDSFVLLLREMLGIRFKVPTLYDMSCSESLRVRASSMDPGG